MLFYNLVCVKMGLFDALCFCSAMMDSSCYCVAFGCIGATMGGLCKYKSSGQSNWLVFFLIIAIAGCWLLFGLVVCW